MREFFRGRRRVVGVATLVLACVLMIGWRRSINHYDLLCIRCGGSFYSAESIGEGIELSHQPVRDPDAVDWQYFRLDSNDLFIASKDGQPTAYSPLRPGDTIDS